MPEKSNRRLFLKGSALVPLSVASGALLTSIPAVAAAPIERIGGAKLKISLNAYSFSKALNDHILGRKKGLTLMELLDFCAEHNFDAIDPTGYFFPGYPGVPTDEYINNFKRRAFQLGLDISGTGVRNDFATPDEASRAADVQHVKEWIEVAARLGAPVIRVFAGPEQEGHSWDDVSEWMAADLRQCADYGKKFGVLVGVQNHGDMLKTAKQTLRMVEMVDSDWFGVIVDTGYFMTDDPYIDIAEVTPYAVNFQVKESPFGKESPIRTDLDRLVRIVCEQGYRGYLPIETLSLPGRPYDPFTLVPKFLAEVREAVSNTRC
ncbi:sugar phosphate isomerase/epimerase family protein [Bythopirellula polymerisocia]|uniref:Xylose isomerase-like TIM barrel n=1 Tax=Bythopirellula polymerisocia TaxID=2528003 RepID=A0A5C6C853_9BACT|nr:sugar phosphate isomerase/epimerase family protein [Bythopirellula polymerisocia]TWU20348.1 Xylose isomerase-like TIM barrel [Bythopirellula polymerisocia]